MLDFLCIGAQKAGTSWLHRQLERHPQVAFPHGKEVHYWDWVQSGKRPDDIAWYHRKFSLPEHEGCIRGDMTPAYAMLEPRWIEQIAGEYPDCRIIYALRNPIERAWSAARMVFDFSQLDLDEVDDAWFIRLFHSRASLARGDYEANLRRWQAHFPASQVLVLFYDDLVKSPRQFLDQTAGFLELDPAPLEALSTAELNRRYQWGPQLDLSPALYAELRSLYEDPIESLGRYLNRDLSQWLKPPEG